MQGRGVAGQRRNPCMLGRGGPGLHAGPWGRVSGAEPSRRKPPCRSILTGSVCCRRNCYIP